MKQTNKNRRPCLLSLMIACVLFAGACSKKPSGPTPEVSGLSPSLVCTRQLTTRVTIAGAGFSPVINDGLTRKPKLILPQVTLRLSHDAAGTLITNGTSFAIPDDPADPLSSRVSWANENSMSFEIFPELGLEPGVYETRVTNWNGRSVSLAESMAAVLPPVITSVVSDILCNAQEDRTITLNGAGFLTVDGVLPRLTIGAETYDASTASGCSPVIGTQLTAKLCTVLTAVIPQNALGTGVHNVTATNPNPAGCSSQETATLTITPPPTLSAIQTDLTCNAGKAPTLTLTGTGMLAIDGSLPDIAIGAEIFSADFVSGCKAVSGPTETVTTCDTLGVTIPANTFNPTSPTSLPVSVSNPALVGCKSVEPIDLEMMPPPVVTTVAPSAVCIGADAVLTVSGGGLLQVGAELPTVTIGTIDYLPESVSNCTPVGGTTLTVMSCTTLSVIAPAGSVPIGFSDLVVTNPTPADCTSSPAFSLEGVTTGGATVLIVEPAVAWNGFDTPVTVFAADVAPAIGEVAMELSGSGVKTPLTFSTPGRADRPVAVVPSSTAAGTYDVWITDASNCPSVLAGALTVNNANTLTLTSVTPSSGWTGEKSTLTITGGVFDTFPTIYLQLSTSATPIPLTSVVSVEANLISVEVPAGVPSGVYDVIVINQDGNAGISSGAFTVSADPLPSVSKLTPSRVPDTNATQVLTIAGRDFRGGPDLTVTLQCIDALGVGVTDQVLMVPPSSASSIDITFDATVYAGGANCVVKVTNSDGMATEFSSLIVVTGSSNLPSFVNGPTLVTARRRLGAVTGSAGSPNRFVYAIAGDDGIGVLKKVEVLPVDKHGRPAAASFFEQDNKLNTARSQLGAARIGRYIYAVGGTGAMGDPAAALNTMERAAILDPGRAPENLSGDIDFSLTAGFAGGEIFYFVVAAVMPITDPFNPGGESLPSTRYGVRLPTLGGFMVQATLSWDPVPGAVGYRIYRFTAGGGDGGLIADTTVALPTQVSCSSATACTDAGAIPNTDKNPLALGETGVWQMVVDATSTDVIMAARRQGAAVTWAFDPTDGTKAYLYVMGGLDEAATTLASVEFLTISIDPTDGRQTNSDTFATTTAVLTVARWRIGGYRVGPTDTALVANASVWAGGGATDAGSTTFTGTFDGAQVQAGGQLLVFGGPGSMSPAGAGYGALAAGDFVYALGGEVAGAAGIPTSNVVSADHTGTPPGLQNFTTSPTPSSLNIPRVDPGAAQQSGYFYIIGGTTTGDTVSASTEYVLY